MNNSDVITSTKVNKYEICISHYITVCYIRILSKIPDI